eukprot:427553_1
MSTIRNPENLNNQWSKIYQFGFGIGGVILSIATIILIIIWLESEDLGGFGSRASTVTKDYFNWHILLMSLAFLLFMTPASTAFEILPFARNRNKQIHGLFQTFAIICIIAGYIIIYDCHMVLTNKGLANTTHSIVGYITISLVVLTYVMGFILYILKYGGVLRGELKPLHKRMGIISLILGYTTILMGLTEKANGFDGYTLTFAQVIVGLVVGTSICVSFAVVKFVDKKSGFDYKPIPNAEENNTVHLTN